MALVGMAVPSRPRVVAGMEHADQGFPSPELPPPADGSESHPYLALSSHPSSSSVTVEFVSGSLSALPPHSKGGAARAVSESPESPRQCGQRLDCMNSIFSTGLRAMRAAEAGTSSMSRSPRSGPSTLTAVARQAAVQSGARTVTRL